MILRQRQQQRVVALGCGLQSRHRHRRRGVAADRLQQDPRQLHADLAHLLGHDEAVALVADQQRRRQAGQPLQPLLRLVQQGLLTVAGQRPVLLGVACPRQGPELRAAAAAEDHRNQGYGGPNSIKEPPLHSPSPRVPAQDPDTVRCLALAGDPAAARSLWRRLVAAAPTVDPALTVLGAELCWAFGRSGALAQLQHLPTAEDCPLDLAEVFPQGTDLARRHGGEDWLCEVYLQLRSHRQTRAAEQLRHR